MKNTNKNLLKQGLALSVALSSSLMLMSCDSMRDVFGGSDVPPDYTYSNPVPQKHFEHTSQHTTQHTRAGEKTTLVEPGISTVKTSKVGQSSSSPTTAVTPTTVVPATSAPSGSPVVPSMAPSVGQ